MYACPLTRSCDLQGFNPARDHYGDVCKDWTQGADSQCTISEWQIHFGIPAEWHTIQLPCDAIEEYLTA